ncbi:conserved hypothetical protein [Ferrimonas balearica DSM 9799]|uniref:6-carboxy-5,6,7,8-tetrahydropterin synthase n=1 Tax=Ferrimonas balearica (strain DSM 9799 / CCM 4581 / KCTC 23876 / PAT) TaxID=550540 RepID=E1SVZ4_FERBD|nr:6-carboxytetrahydropterin synthase [Ferrimonas balearica]ADN77445.1 conserved hypothetical protein [Ferrimonas balearica DSM 9799]
MKLFVNDLTVIDSSVVHVERGIVGESWIVDLQLSGDLNNESMVLDFGIVKKQIKSLIDELVDHCLLVPASASSLEFCQEPERTWVKNNHSRHATFYVQGPEQAFCFIDADSIDEQSVSLFLEESILPQLPSNVQGLKLTLRSEQIDEPYYHYSHGLKKHSGNCQRIAHGHRSRVRVFNDGQLDRELQTLWAKRWEDIYLITEDDIAEVEAMSMHAQDIRLENAIGASYVSPQGYFEILLPVERVEVMVADSTVECIAEYIATRLAELRPNHKIEVHAFEGVGKGAIAEQILIV